MGLKDKFNKAILKLDNTQKTFLSEQIDAMFKSIILKKIERLKSENKEVTVENLMKGWESLKAIGYNEETAKAKVEEIIKEINA